MFCTNCGTSNLKDAELCIQCGESLEEPEIKIKPFHQRKLKKMGVLKHLFDFSFDEYITSRISKFLYALSILYAGLLAILCIVVGFSVSKLFGFFMLVIGAPLIFLLTLVYSRILLETAIVVSRTASQTSEIAKRPDSKDGIQWNL